MACWKLDEGMSFKIDRRYPKFVTVKIGNFDRLASAKDIERLRDTCNEILATFKENNNE